jgi:hypothetical protein
VDKLQREAAAALVQTVTEDKVLTGALLELPGQQAFSQALDGGRVVVVVVQQSQVETGWLRVAAVLVLFPV